MKIKFKSRQWWLSEVTAKRLTFTPAPDVSKLLAQWRQARGLHQRAAAKALGISQGQLARIESGTRPGTPELLARLTA